MTRFDVAVLAFRILALYFLLGVLSGLARMVGILSGEWTTPLPVLSWSLPIALVAGLGLLLFWKAPAIARGLYPADQPLSTASRPEIGALALQVCGIMLFADFLSQSSQFLEGNGTSELVGKLAVVALGLIGVLIFVGSRPLARRVFGAPTKPLPAHVQAVTLSVVGIWLLVSSLPLITAAVGEHIERGVWGRQAWGEFATALLGLLLFLGGAGLSAFWYWMRHAGLAPRAQNPR